MLENKQVRRSFFSVLFMPYNKSFIDQASSVKMAGYWPRYLFTFLWTSTSSWSIKTQKENSANIQPSWPRAWSIIYTYISMPPTDGKIQKLVACNQEPGWVVVSDWGKGRITLRRWLTTIIIFSLATFTIRFLTWPRSVCPTDSLVWSVYLLVAGIAIKKTLVTKHAIIGTSSTARLDTVKGRMKARTPNH